ncbi:MAG: hypothetical protein GY862_20760 [Gammaproteobacteria bacterium]|nr:hypothetical protein [Gammaproteobacteria bacterium]
MNKSEASLGSRIFPWTKIRWKPHSFVGRGDFFKSLYIDLTGGLNEQNFANLPQVLDGLAPAGKYLLAQGSSRQTHYVLDVHGTLIDDGKDSVNHYSRVYAWNEENDRIYFFSDRTTPNDLHYEEINQVTGMITDSGETPHHGDYFMMPPIRISQDGAFVLLGNGDIYDAATLTRTGSLQTRFIDAVWVR